MDYAGDFVITWTSYGQGQTVANNVYARRFSAAFDPGHGLGDGGQVFLGDATQASDVFQVNQSFAGNKPAPRSSTDAAGDFMVTWDSNQSGSTYDIYARRYACHQPDRLRARVTIYPGYPSCAC